ncbi:PAS domain S-box protein [bacterium]|nr:PAS domain S-box protein [bacterium]
MSHPSPKKCKCAEFFGTFNQGIPEIQASYHDLSHEIQKHNKSLALKIRQLEDHLENADYSQQFFYTILDSIDEGVVVVDNHERIIFINRGAEILTGYTRKSAVGCLYKELLGQHLSERFTPAYTLKYKESQLCQEKEIISKSKKKIPVRFSSYPIFNRQDHLAGVIEVITDLTRLKQLESVKQEIRTQASLEQMAGLIANEIRNPLEGILGNVDVIMKSSHKECEYKDRLQAIKTSVDQINSVVSRFQWFAKSVKPNFETLDLIQYIKEVLKIFIKNNHIDENKIIFNFIYPRSHKTFMWSIDPVLLEQVLFDILDNGVKALSETGTITIHLLRHSGLLKNDSIEIDISDTGRGMSRKELSQLFTPFYTTRARGLGLSLAVARRFIILHRGNIQVESAVGKGSTFKISLPK